MGHASLGCLRVAAADAGRPPCLFSVAFGPARLHFALEPMDTTRKRTPLWHSLLYSTGFLLIVCGIPATVALAFLSTSHGLFNLTASDALRFGAYMVASEALLAGALLFVAEFITKRRRRE